MIAYSFKESENGHHGSHLKALNETNPMIPISSHPHTHTPSQVLIHRLASDEGMFLSVTDNLFDHDLFLLSWGPTVAALSFVFDNAEARGIVDKAIAGCR